MTIEAILFDKDGTLLDFGETFLPAIRHTLTTLAEGDEKRLGKLEQVSMVDLEIGVIAADSPLVADSVGEIAALFAPHLPAELSTNLAEKLDQLFLEGTKQSVSAFPYVRDTLTQLHGAGLALGVATNDTEAAAHQHLKATDLADLFDFVVGYDSGHGAKPGPGMVEAFIKTRGLAPRSVMMVGDSIHDLMAGRAAGAVTLGVTCGTVGADVLAPHADHILPDISHLPGLLKTL